MTEDGERQNWCLREIFFNGAAVTEVSRVSLISAFRAGLLTLNVSVLLGGEQPWIKCL